MTITLYKFAASPVSRTVIMVVQLLALKTEDRTVSTILGEQFNPEYVAKNPLHTVPIIEDGDFILADSHAIITYLVSKYGADKAATLYPSDLKIRATIDQRMYFDSTYLFPRFFELVRPIFRENAKTILPEHAARIEEVYGFLETYLTKSKYLAAEHLTLADISAVSTVSTLDLLVPIGDKYPKLIQWYECLKEQEWFKKGNTPGMHTMDNEIKQRMNSTVWNYRGAQYHDTDVRFVQRTA